MVDVAHDGHDRRTRLQASPASSAASNRPSSTSDSATRRTRVAEFLGDELGGIGVDRVGDLRHVALLHQDADDVDGALRHAVGEFLDGDRLRDRHFARRSFPCSRCRDGRSCAGCGGGTRRPNARAPRRRVSAVTTVSRPRASRRAGARRLRRRRRTRGAAPAPRRTRTALVFVGFERERARARPRLQPRLRFVAAEPLLGDLVGLALGFFVVPAALFFVALARFGGLALGALDAPRAARGCLRLFLGDLAFFGLAHAGIGRARARARSALPRSACAARRRTALAAARPAWRRAPVRRRGAARSRADAARRRRRGRPRSRPGLGLAGSERRFDLLDHHRPWCGHG